MDKGQGAAELAGSRLGGYLRAVPVDSMTLKQTIVARHAWKTP
jgi:hypothetical protein